MLEVYEDFTKKMTETIETGAMDWDFPTYIAEFVFDTLKENPKKNFTVPFELSEYAKTRLNLHGYSVKEHVDKNGDFACILQYVGKDNA